MIIVIIHYDKDLVNQRKQGNMISHQILKALQNCLYLDLSLRDLSIIFIYTFYLALFNFSTIQQIVAFAAPFTIAIVFSFSTIH